MSYISNVNADIGEKPSITINIKNMRIFNVNCCYFMLNVIYCIYAIFNSKIHSYHKRR